LVMHGQTIRFLRKIAPIHWVFVLSFMCVLLLDAVSAPTKSCECGLNATWVYTWPMYFVFCRLYPLSHQPPRLCLVPTCYLSTHNYYRRCGLA
jgi:hypothetical protein